MPVSAPQDPVARALGVRTNTHPRLSGGEILLPDDVLEGLGNMTERDALGDPRGMRIGRREQPEYRHVYAGPGPDGPSCTRQTTNGVPAEQSSWLGNQALVNGVPFPTGDGGGRMLAKLPTPEAPTIIKEKVGGAVGFAATTAASPGWLSLAYSRDGVGWGPLSPPVSYHNGHGQGLRVKLPRNAQGDAGVGFVGIFAPAPGTSSPSGPGPMHLLKAVDLSRYFLDHYDLTGPFRPLREAPEADETGLGWAPAPVVRHRRTRYVSKAGTYRAMVVFTVGEKESQRGAISSPVTIGVPWSDGGSGGGSEVPTGYGYLEIEIPPAPAGATGFYVYVQVGIEWYRLWSRSADVGRTTPLPLSWRKVWTGGWQGDESVENSYVNYYAQTSDGLLSSAEPPAWPLDATALPAPDSAPEAPEAIGRARMGPGRLYFRVTDGVDGLQTLPSPPVAVDLADDEVPRVVFANPVNRIPNGDHTERSATDAGLPLDHSFTTDNGTVSVDEETGEPILQTTAVVTNDGPAPTQVTSWVGVDPATGGRAAARIKLEDPKRGKIEGALEVVLEEEDEGGAVTQTVLGSLTAKGEARIDRILYPAGTPLDMPGLPPNPCILKSGTRRCRIRCRFAGSRKNGKAHVHYVECKRHKHRHRRRKRRRLLRRRRRGGAIVLLPKPLPPPGGEVEVEPPPTPPVTPEPTTPPVGSPPATSPAVRPDRPLSTAATTGKVREELFFEAGLPTGWTQENSASATIQTGAAAAIEGASGLILKDISTTEAGHARLKKDFGAGPFLGVSWRARWAEIPSNGYVELFPLKRASDGRSVAWLECGTISEIAELTVESSPEQPGSVTVNLDGTPFDVAVGATKEAATLTVNAAPTAPGTATIDAGGVSVNVEAGGAPAVARMTTSSLSYDYWAISTAARAYVDITLNGTVHTVAFAPGHYLASQVAQKIAAATFSGWRVNRSNFGTLSFSATQPGARSGAYSVSVRGANVYVWSPFTMVLSQPGSMENAASFAARIRATDFGPEWTLGQGTSSNVVTFSATRAGAKTDLSFNPGATGAAATAATTTQGSADTPAQLAERIRTGPVGGYPGFTTGGTGNLVTFSATAAGDKQDASFDPQATGVVGEMVTTRRGQNADLFVKVRDDADNIIARKLTSALAVGGLWNVDYAVSGAGTDEAVVSVWGSVGNDPKTLLERFEWVDLRQSLVGLATLGVDAESSTATTWELHVDDVRVTERGEQFYHDHDWKGALVRQLHHYGLPSQPMRDDLGFQELLAAVIPGATYTLSAYVRNENAASATVPVSLRAFGGPAQGAPIELADISVSGDGEWRALHATVTIPPGCHTVEIRSRALGSGEVVVQEVALSPGTVAKRTGRYATSGTYSVILRLAPDNEPDNVLVGRRRKLLEAETEASEAAGTAISASYRSANTLYDPWGPAHTDPALVEDRRFIEATFLLSGTGLATPELVAGSPRAEYLTLIGGRHAPVFLSGTREELPGGAFFDHIEEPAEDPDAAMRELPGRRLRPQVFGDASPQLPGGAARTSSGMRSGQEAGESVVLYVFTPESRRLIEKHWYEPWAEEAFGEAMRVRLAAMPVFHRVGESATYPAPDDPFFSHALYVAEMPPREVLSREPLAP